MDKRIPRMRALGSAALLIILAMCGYIGADSEELRTVSVAVSRSAYTQNALAEDAALSSDERLRDEREKEIAMLKDVESSESADQQTKAQAQAQLAQIAQRMEIEAQAAACLEEMGFTDCAVFSGAQMLHILMPYDMVADEQEKNRVLDAVCSLTGYDAADIKIILTKK